MNIAGVIKIHQTLHGYDNGHRLLSSSRDLPTDTNREMLALSDLSGQSIAPGFEAYLTAYPLPELDSYALARTWLATEMNRPGCVWTHTLLMDFTDLAAFQSVNQLYTLFKLFQRPKIKSDKKELLSGYRQVIDFSFPDLANTPGPGLSSSEPPSPDLKKLLIRGLYESHSSPVFLIAPNANIYEELILSVWLQQWPRLRRQFAFCTGVNSNRKQNGHAFDLQVGPPTLATSVYREVSDAVLLSDKSDDAIANAQPPIENSELDSNKSEISWLDIATRDLTAGNLLHDSKFRRFLRKYGANISTGRSSFASLAEIFIALEKVNHSENITPDLLQLLETIAGAFPRAKQAHSLKSNTFGQTSPNEDVKVSEKNVLEALALTPYYKIFERSSLNVQSRVESLWKQNREDAEALLIELVRRSKNPFFEDVISAIARNATPHEALTLFQRSPSLGSAFVQQNKTLIESPILWSGTLNLQCELFDALAEVSLTEREQKKIVAAIFSAQADGLATEVGRRFGSVAVLSILAHIEDFPQPVSSPWRSLLETFSDHLVAWLRKQVCFPSLNDHAIVEVVIPLIIQLNPTMVELAEIPAVNWVSLLDKVSKSAKSRSSQDIEAEISSFTLAIGLLRSDKEASLIVERAFQTVHDVLAQDKLPFTAWKWLDHRLPSLGHNNWDKCERLRRATIEHFDQNDWPIERFVSSIKDTNTLEEIVASCQHTSSGGSILKKIRKRMSDGDTRIPVWQRPFWQKKKLHIFSVFDIFVD